MALTDDLVRDLATFKGEKAPVTSLYLDVDGRHHRRAADYERELARMLRRVRDEVDHANGHATCRDLKRIEDHVRGGFDRSRVRGLAIFSCQVHDYWRVIELPVPVPSQLVVNHSPHVRPLEALLESAERYAVLLADRQRARLLSFELGELVEDAQRFDALPRHDDDHGEWDRDHVRDHAHAVAHRHLRAAADLAFRVFQEQGFHHLVLGAPDEIAHELERLLHPYLRDRIAARVHLPLAARSEEIRQAMLDVEAEVERRRQAHAVDRLRDALGSGSGGVGGLDPTLRALAERRVDTMLVSEGFEQPGWRCRGCGHIAAKGRACPVCTAAMDRVDDVVEEAVEEALAQSCRVIVCRENADLDVLGRIGALLRF